MAAAAGFGLRGEIVLTNKERRISGPSGDAPVRRAWEPMSPKRIGTFGDVLKGATGPAGDGTLKRRPT